MTALGDFRNLLHVNGFNHYIRTSAPNRTTVYFSKHDALWILYPDTTFAILETHENGVSGFFVNQPFVDANSKVLELVTNYIKARDEEIAQNKEGI